MPNRQVQRTAITGWKLLALVMIAGLIGAQLVRADDAYLTGSGQGYNNGCDAEQGAYPSAYVNTFEDGYDFCLGQIIRCGTIFSICRLLDAMGPSAAGPAAGPAQLYFAQRATPRHE